MRVLGDAVELVSVEPVSQQQLARAHHRDFVAGALNGSTSNGFGNRDRKVALSLSFTSGSLLAAAKHARLHREVTVSPTSGFHHAGYGQSRRFCTFKGFTVTALALKDAGPVDRLAILNCAAHYGDGTDSIIRALGIADARKTAALCRIPKEIS